VGKVISGVCDFVCRSVRVCPRSESKTTRAINSNLSTAVVRRALTRDQKVKGEGRLVIKRAASGVGMQVDTTARVKKLAASDAARRIYHGPRTGQLG